MMDWLVVWGVAQAAGVLAKPILEDLAKESAKDYVKDFFKDCLKKVIRLPEPDVQKEAYGKALKEFLELVEAELIDADYQEVQIRQYTQPLNRFVKDEKVAAILGEAFEAGCQNLDTQTLAQRWEDLGLPFLPDSFDWEQVCKNYIRKVRVIVRGSEELRSVFMAEAQTAIAEGIQEIKGITPAFDLSRYAEALQEQYGNLKLESLDTTGVYYNELKLWKVFVPQNVRECREFLPQVYELPKEHQRRLRESGQLSEEELEEVALERSRKLYVEQPIRPVLEVVGDPDASVGAGRQSASQNMVILGDPGSGKSTLLQYLALTWANHLPRELVLHPIPLLIELRTYARDKQEKKCSGILDFIHSGNVLCWLNQQQLHEKLKAGQAIALFDGIDEVFDPALRDEVVRDIHRFSNEYSQVQVLVTSRWLGYKAQTLRDAGFHHFMLQDLEEEQIEDFIQRWHDLTFQPGADKNRKQERLRKAVRDSKAIRELAGNPLLLTMMAILNRNQELPRDRPELYNQASRVLLHQWDVERALVEDQRLDPKTIDYRDKQAMLRQVAYHMQSTEKGLAGNIIHAADLEGILTDYLKSIEVEQPRTVARLMINQLRIRNFILCYLGGDSYAFVHRTFLEYFCAWEFVWRFKEKQTLTIGQLIQDVYAAHWKDEAWHEVMCLIASMIDETFTGRIIQFLLSQSGKEDEFGGKFLAAKCLAEVRNRTNVFEVSHLLLRQLQDLTEYQLDYHYIKYFDEVETNIVFRIRTRAVRAIAATWPMEKSTAYWLKELSQNNRDEDVRLVAIQELARGWKNDFPTLPIVRSLAENDKRSMVRSAALIELAHGWKDGSSTLTWLKARAYSDESDDVQEVAVQEIARGWRNDPGTLQWLKTYAWSEDEIPQRAAVHEVAHGWKKDVDTLTWLKTCVDLGGNDILRIAALQEIARGWKDEQDTLSLITKCISDESCEVRRAAVEALARGWRTDTHTLSILKLCVTSDQDFDVRIAAINALGRDWKDDLSILDLLKACAESDKDSDVRVSAIRQIINGWKNEFETLSWLKSRAEADGNHFVRNELLDALARGWRDDPQMFDFLCERAFRDTYRRSTSIYAKYEINPRLTALAGILENYSDHPRTANFLSTCALNDSDENVREFAKRQLETLEQSI